MDVLTAVRALGEVREWLRDPTTYPQRPGMTTAAADMLDIVAEILALLAEAQHG